MKYCIGLLLLCSTLLFSFVSFHPIYISTAEIDYNKERKAIEIAVKVFSDDLEKILTKQEGTTIEIGTDREDPNATQYIIEYFKDHFQLELNGKKVDLTYVNRKLLKEEFFAMWVLFEVPKINKIKSLSLKNNVLIDLHEEQKNYVKFRETRSGSYNRMITSRGSETVVLK